MNTLNDKANVNVQGHVIIRDADTNEILLDKYNAINFQNFAFAVAHTLANRPDDNGNGYFISHMAFGYGGTIIDANGNVEYRSAKVDGTANEGLHSPTQVNGSDYMLPITFTEDNIKDASSQPYTDLECIVTLDYDEPSQAMDFDTATDFEDNDSFVFDEIALKTQAGSHLTHLIFHPIQKSKNRKLEIIYTIRIRAGA